MQLWILWKVNTRVPVIVRSTDQHLGRVFFLVQSRHLHLWMAVLLLAVLLCAFLVVLCVLMLTLRFSRSGMPSQLATLEAFARSLQHALGESWAHWREQPPLSPFVLVLPANGKQSEMKKP